MQPEPIQEEPAKEWRIDSYQVPVPTGDCSLHFLVNVSRIYNKEKNEIERSIIVDGGEGAEEASDAIDMTMKALSGSYSNGIRPFDFWLVTHWDTDHYAGALHYLTKFDLKPIVFAPVAYDDKDYGMTDAGVSMSTYEFLAAESPDEQDFGVQFTHREIYEVGPKGEQYVVKDFFAEDIAKLNVVMSLPVGKNREPRLTDFLDANSGWDKRPGFFCIGANGWCFSSMERLPVPDRNATSAMFVIAWGSSDKIRYYAAGEGNRAVEENFAKAEIFKRDAEDEASWGTHVAKGTHHGALNSFVKELFVKMQPENYVVSAGTQYGHPTAALLVEFAAYKLQQTFKFWTSRYPYWLFTEEAPMNTELNVKHVQDVIKSLEKSGFHKKVEMEIEGDKSDDDDVMAPLHKEFSRRIPPLLQELSDTVRDTEITEKVIESVAMILELLWTALSESPPPENENREMPYRIDMHFWKEHQNKEDYLQVRSGRSGEGS